MLRFRIMSETLFLLSDLLGSRKSVDETTPDRPVFQEIDPKLIPSQSAPNDPSGNPNGNPSDHPSDHPNSPPLQAEIRDDILVEDLAPPLIVSVDLPLRSRDRNFEQAIALLEHYSFEIEGGSARELVSEWAVELPSEWLRLAVLEALYQGRYKAVSVSQILAIWERKQQPKTHFNGEFERLICDRLFAEVEADAQAAMQAEPVEELTAGEVADGVIDPVTSVRLPDLSLPSGDPIAVQPEPDAAELPLQRSQPTQIAQFVPEGDSHVYDKLRDLARSNPLDEESSPPAV